MGWQRSLWERHRKILSNAIARVKEGRVQLLYISPESLLTNHQWREMLRSEVYRENLVAFVVDEAHCVKQW